MEQIMVSILCTTYNHEKYVKQALDGFLMQKTNFLYEVLVHDDASTDNTKKIISEYAQKFPSIIKPIYQTENQYSKGVQIFDTFLYPRAQGKYIAICEGDDYWISDLKLQKQFDILENDNSFGGCVHSVEMKNATSGKCLGFIQPLKYNGKISLEDTIKGGGEFIGTSSIMFRKDIINNDYKFYRELSLDYVMQINMALNGGIYYLNDAMSVYRVMTEGSWTSRMRNKPQEINKLAMRIIGMLKLLDEETDFMYHSVISSVILERQCYIEARNGNVLSFFTEPLNSCFFKLQTLKKIKFIAQALKNLGKKYYEKQNN